MEAGDARERLDGAKAQAKEVSPGATSYSKIQEPAKNIVEPSERSSSEADSEEQANQSCLGYHAPEILKMYRQQLHEQVILAEKSGSQSVKPVFIVGELNLAIDEKKVLRRGLREHKLSGLPSGCQRS